MPIYEYRCRKCGEDFEVLFRNRDEKMSVACPKCESNQDATAHVRIFRKDREYRRRRCILRELRRHQLRPLLRALTLHGREP